MNDFPANKFRKLIDRKIASRAYIDYFPLPHIFAFRRQDIRPHDIPHMGEVACLRPIAPDGERLSFLSLFQKLTDCKRVRSIGIKPRTVYIKVTQRNRLKAVYCTPHLSV